MASSRPKPQTRRPTKPRRGINLGGQGDSWDVSFSNGADLAGAVTFQRKVSDAGYPTVSRHTLNIFHNGAIRFRDSKSIESTKRNMRGEPRNLDLSIHAGIEVAPQTYDIVRHEGDGQRWVTMIKLRPRQRFLVNSGIRPITLPPTSGLSLHTVRLWTERARVGRMHYMTIVVHDHMKYQPWKIVMQKQVLGPTVSARVDDVDSKSPLICFADKSASASAGNAKSETTKMADASSATLSEATSCSFSAPGTAEPPNAETRVFEIASIARSPESELVDAFKGIWEQARMGWLDKHGQKKKEETQGGLLKLKTSFTISAS